MPADHGPPVDAVTAAVHRFPTPQPEADGTLTWDATVAVTVTLHAGDTTGLGWTYSSPAAAAVVRDHLADVVTAHGVFDVTAGWAAMHRAGRNVGTTGLYLQAMSAVDIAWWDLKARVLGVGLPDLFGCCRDTVPAYGSGGFTTLSEDELADQISSWRAAGVPAMKIKIGENWGTKPERDIERVAQLREQAGPDVELMVDANGGYRVGRAKRIGHRLDELGVTWFEEPVSSDDTDGLGVLREALRCDVTAGEYASDGYAVRRLLPVVDCLQLDATRCGGYTGFLRYSAVAATHNRDVSAHCAPALHAPVAVAVPNLRHVEWFVDHARLEPQLVSGVPPVRTGALQPDLAALGHGMRLRDPDDDGDGRSQQP